MKTKVGIPSETRLHKRARAGVSGREKNPSGSLAASAGNHRRAFVLIDFFPTPSSDFSYLVSEKINWNTRQFRLLVGARWIIHPTIARPNVNLTSQRRIIIFFGSQTFRSSVCYAAVARERSSVNKMGVNAADHEPLCPPEHEGLHRFVVQCNGAFSKFLYFVPIFNIPR